jgi:excisionase family DNA binding protein
MVKDVLKFFENKLVWTVSDVARELGCSTRHIRKMVSDDNIPYCKVGRLVRFSPLRISEWLRNGGTR